MKFVVMPTREEELLLQRFINESPYYTDSTLSGDKTGADLCDALADKFFKHAADRILSGDAHPDWAVHESPIQASEYINPKSGKSLAIILTDDNTIPFPVLKSDPDGNQFKYPMSIVAESLKARELDYGPSFDRRASPAEHFARKGDIETVAKLMEIANQPMEKLLLTLVQKDATKAATAMLQSGLVDVNAVDEFSRTPIYHARSVGMFDALAAAGANLAHRDKFNDPITTLYDKAPKAQPDITIDADLKDHAIAAGRKNGIDLSTGTKLTGSFSRPGNYKVSF